MKSIVAAIAVVAALVAAPGVARAQAQGQARPSSIRDYETGYVEGIAQSAFGNVTSQSFGAEVGFKYGRRLRIFGEVGDVRDSAPKTLGTGAQLVASALASIQSGAVTYSVRQPVMFGLAGVRYMIPHDDKIEPYVTAGFGIARVKRDVSWTIAGNDVTSTLATYGVALGSDLSGTVNKPMMSAGAGVVWNFHGSVFADLQYRFGRVFDDVAFTVNRVGAGIGVRF